jgi:hypothetical protein
MAMIELQLLVKNQLPRLFKQYCRFTALNSGAGAWNPWMDWSVGAFAHAP